KNRERINDTIKKREWFRPLAPSVLERYAPEWFDPYIRSPFMLFTTKVKLPEEVPAIVHVDGSARPQTVNEETDAAYYRLLEEFFRLTGIPMLLNTSLNGPGQPLLETAEEARKFWQENDVDVLVVNGEIHTK